MDLTTVFTAPNAHHIFGSRSGFSEFLVPSGIHFGGSWIVFGYLLGPRGSALGFFWSQCLVTWQNADPLCCTKAVYIHGGEVGTIKPPWR